MMRTHKLPQTFWPFTADAAAFVKNVIPNIEGRIPYSAFYDKDPRKPFNLLQTFGCLAWVHIPKAKRKKLDDTAIPAIFVRYDKEHKGWKFVSQNHSPPIFWSNAARFIEDQSCNDRTDAIPIQEVDAMHYDDPMDIEHLGYTEEDVHDKGKQQVNDIYLPLEEQDPTPEGDQPNLKLNESHSTLITTTTAQDPMLTGRTQVQTTNGHGGNLNDKTAAIQEAHPWLHPATIAKLLRIYKEQLPVMGLSAQVA